MSWREKKSQEGSALSRKPGRRAVRVVSNDKIADGIWQMVVEYPQDWQIPKAGQFVNLYCNHKGRLLPRPISVCEVEYAKNLVEGGEQVKAQLHLVYAVVGKGTKEFARLASGSTVAMLSPLGSGFHIPKDGSGSKRVPQALLIGGGVGIPPLIELAKRLSRLGWSVLAALGFRDHPFLYERMAQFAEVSIATESGRVGFQGNVLEMLDSGTVENGAAYGDKMAADMIFACGPAVMLRAVQEFARERDIPAQISLEERMGCGFGGCVGCVVRTASAEKSSGSAAEIHYKKVCKDGPVFAAEEILFTEQSRVDTRRGEGEK